MAIEPCDLLCIGSGPAAMSAAINGASEGLRVTMIDSGSILGGQARESSAIENYPGFPDGITGNDLMQAFVKQALRFGVNIHCPLAAVKLWRGADAITVRTDDYGELTAKAVLIGIGLSYRKLDIQGIGPLMGQGIWYGLPPFVDTRKKESILVVGGANSAGQAVLKLARNKNASITVVIRRTIYDSMSAYLIERIKKCPNVRVLEGYTVQSVHGVDCLESVYLTGPGVAYEEKCNRMYIFIGAIPKTTWVDGTLDLDDHKFIKTWPDARYASLPYETSTRGVFAAGDVRSGSIKRIASAIGEGAGALQMIHRYLSDL